MKKFRLALIAAAAALLLGSAGIWFINKDAPVSLAPQWKIGQEWRVNVFHRAEKGRKNAPEPWTFRVQHKDTIDRAQAIYTIKASSLRRSGDLFIIKVRHPDMTLVNVVTYVDGRIVMNEAPRGSAFFFNKEGVWSMPLDFSTFPVYTLSRQKRSGDFTAEKVIELSEENVVVWQRSEFTQKVLPGRTVRLLQIKMTAAAAGTLVQNFQSWEIGKPWWTDARRTVNGNLVTEGVLID